MTIDILDGMFIRMRKNSSYVRFEKVDPVTLEKFMIHNSVIKVE